MSLPEEKRTQLRCAANSLWDHTRVTARTLMRFLGSVTFAAYAVPLARLQARELQTALRKVYKLPRDLLKQVTLPPETRHNLQFWRTLQHCSRPLRRPSPAVIMATDASKKGWGASLHSSTASGPWPKHLCSLHINCLEMWAVKNALETFQQELWGKCVGIQIDNKTVVAYLQKEGWGGGGATPHSCHVCPARSCCGVTVTTSRCSLST